MGQLSDPGYESKHVVRRKYTDMDGTLQPGDLIPRDRLAKYSEKVLVALRNQGTIGLYDGEVETAEETESDDTPTFGKE
jgi:hypothetical protein